MIRISGMQMTKTCPIDLQFHVDIGKKTRKFENDFIREMMQFIKAGNKSRDVVTEACSFACSIIKITMALNEWIAHLYC